MIDWTKPIEWHWNGKNVPCEYVSGGGGYPDDYPIRIKTASTGASCNQEGLVFACEGYIRNVTMPEPTATWWARRWYDSASPDEREAMRVILAGEG